MGRDQKKSTTGLEPGAESHTHRGEIADDDPIGLGWETETSIHSKKPLLAPRRSPGDKVRIPERSTRITGGKDAGCILMKLTTAPSCWVVEEGPDPGVREAAHTPGI